MIIYIGWVKKIIAKFCLRELSEVLLRVDLYIAESPTNFIVEVSVIAESPSNFIVEVSVIAESTTNFIEVSNHHLNHILYIGGVCRREVFLFHLKAFFIHSSQSNNIRFMSIVYVVDYPHQVFVLGVGIEK